MLEPKGVVLDIDLDDLVDDLFKDDESQVTPPVTDEKKLELTAAMTKRINEVKTKTEAEVRDKLAKDLGFENYAALEKAKDKKLITEAGYDPDELETVLNPLIEKRLANDPRMLKLKQLEEDEQAKAITAQFAEIEKLTGLKVTEKDLSQETLDLWGKGVTLTQAYLATNHTKILGANSRGTTTHLATGAGTGPVKFRGLTEDEKNLYRSINPGVSEEDLNKKTLEVK